MKSSLTRSIMYLFFRYLLQRKYLVATIDKFNLSFKFRIEDTVGRYIYKRKFYEEELTNFLINKITLDDGDIIFDIGANIGWYSIIFEKKSLKDVKIYAFEPDPLNYSLLQENIKLNNCKNIIPINKAVSDKEGVEILYLYPNKNRGRHSLIPFDNAEEVKIKTISLDKFVEKANIDLGRIKFMKIDIEGYEYIALKGAKNLISHVPSFLMEYSPQYMERGGIDPKDLLYFIKGYKFKPHFIKELALKEVSFEKLIGSDHDTNLFWSRK